MAVFEDVLRDAAKKQVSPFTFRRTYPAYLIGILLLLITIVAWQLIKNTVELERQATFEKASESVVSRLDKAARVHENIVRSIRELFGSSIFIVRDVFELYGSTAPKTFTSVQSVAFVPKVERENVPEFIHYAQSERYYDYRLTPPDTVYDVNYPVFYIVPLERQSNKEFVGRNLAADPLSHKAIERAFANPDTVTATPFTSIRSDIQGIRLFSHVHNRSLIKLPLAQPEMEGVVMVEVLAKEFFAYAFRETAPTDTLITFVVLQEGTSGIQDTVFTAPNYATVTQQPYIPKFARQFPVTIGDQRLYVAVQTVPQFGTSFTDAIPTLVLVGGIIFSLAVFAFVLSITTSRAVAENLANQMTAAQRRILAASSDMIGVMDPTTVVLGINEAVEKILGYTVEEFVNQRLLQFIDQRDQQLFQQTLEQAEDEKPVVVDVRMSTKDGQMRWISWNCTVSRSDGVIYIIGRDVTLQKQAEEELKLWNKQLELARLDVAAISAQQEHLVEEMGHYFTTNLFRLREILENLQHSADLTPEEQQRLLEQAFEEAQQLMGNVGELLSSVREQARHVEEQQQLPLDPVILQTLEQELAALGIEQQWQIHNNPLMQQFSLEVDRKDFVQAFKELFTASKLSGVSGEIFFELNPYDKVLEMQILLEYDPALAEAIMEIQQVKDSQQLRQLLRNDENGIRYALLHAQKLLRIQGGVLKFDVLGEDGILAVLNIGVHSLAEASENLERAL